jgi:outer membrane protein
MNNRYRVFSSGCKKKCATRRIRSAALVAAALAAVASMVSCSSINSGGYENYLPSAMSHDLDQQTSSDPVPTPLPTATSIEEETPGGVKANSTSVQSVSSTTGSQTQNISITLQQALLMGLQNNSALTVQRYNPSIALTQVEAQRGAFDPILGISAQAGKNSTPGQVFGSGGYVQTGGQVVTDSENGSANLSENLPTGTNIQLGANINNSDTEGFGGQNSSTGFDLTLTQALLQGGDLQANLAAIREAQIGVQISDYELRGVAQTIVSQVINAYWAYALGQQNVSILLAAVQVAQNQERQARELIRVGRIAASELPAAAAEVAVNQEQLVAAQGALRIARLTLLSIITPPGQPFWDNDVTLLNTPFIPIATLSPLPLHVQLAFKFSPVINQTKLQIQQGDLAVVQTKNGLLPQLNLFITLGKTGYARNFGESVGQINGEGYEILGGINFNYPIMDRTPHAAYESAVLTRNQDQAAYSNLCQTTELNIRSDYVQSDTDRQQIEATRATTQAQAETLRATIGEFRVGESTSLLVAQAQSNLLAAQLTQAQAVVNYLNALTQLYLDEGTLLQRCHLDAPGAFPVQTAGPAWVQDWPDNTFH